MNTRTAWKDLLAFDVGSIKYESILMVKLGQTLRFPQEPKVLVMQHYPVQNHALTDTLNTVQLVFSRQVLDATWDRFIKHIDNNCLSALSLVSAILDNKFETKLIDKALFNDYKGRIRGLIDDYMITGSMPILDALQSFFGRPILDPKFKLI